MTGDLSKPLPPKPLGKKRGLLISIRHVQPKAGSSIGSLADLEFAHRDAEELRDALIASHGYQADDIILMKDDEEYPRHLWPTHRKILRQIDQLISDAPEKCHFFFYFSGHGLEVEPESDDRASMRADGLEDEIVCADGKPILDHMLHDRLIKPLEKLKDSKLFALFDCCHSETLLDLQRGNGPNRYSRVWKIGPGQRFKDLATIIFNLLKISKKYRWKHNNVPPAPRRASSKLRSPPEYKTKEMGELDVICLSACRDGQLAHDDCERGLTFTKCFLNAMAAKPNITWTELRDAVKGLVSEIRTRYEAYLQDPASESDLTHESWTQSPRVCTGSNTDLTRRVSF